MFYIIATLVCMLGMSMAYDGQFKNLREKPQLAAAKSLMQKRKTDLSLWIMKHNNGALDRELFNSSIILKNLALVKRETPLSGDYMIESLMQNSSLLRNVYGEILIMYRNGRDEDAFKILAMSIGTKASNHFAIILARLDKMNPAELEEQMNIFQKSMMEERMTYSVKRVQRNSMILTTLSTVTVFLLLLNFVVVVVFMNTIESLNNLFV